MSHYRVTDARPKSNWRCLPSSALTRLLPDSDSVRQEVGAWEREPNDHGIKVHWRFCSTDARAKLP